MATKYHYEVYEKVGDKHIPHAQEYNTYEEAKAKLDHLNMLVHPEPRPCRDFGIDKWRMIGNGEPELLGECVDGDLEAPYSCNVCKEELFEGDQTYFVANGTIINSNHKSMFMTVNNGFNIVACIPCGAVLSDAIGIARATIVKQKGGGE